MQLPRFPKSDLTLSKMARSTSQFWNRFLFFFSDNLKKYPRTFGIRFVFLGLFFCKPSQIPIENNPYHQLFT
ncbi:hypothetical protein IQA88_18710, partial [Leptospira interrogans serovar Pomona]|nr:hypothetical protein [Leptospira interrogans serovar Pomona]